MSEELEREPLLAAELAAFNEEAPHGLGARELARRNFFRLEWRDDQFTKSFAGSLDRNLVPVGRILPCGDLTVLRSSPFALLAYSDTLDVDSLAHRLEALATSSDSSLVDVSHGLVALEIAGERSRTVLDGFCPLDLSNLAFTEQSVLRTTIQGHTITMVNQGQDCLELIMDRSYALSFWQRLRRHIALF